MLGKALDLLHCLSRKYQFKFFKGCLPKILPGSFLNTLTYIYFCQNENINGSLFAKLGSHHVFQKPQQTHICSNTTALTLEKGVSRTSYWYLYF